MDGWIVAVECNEGYSHIDYHEQNEPAQKKSAQASTTAKKKNNNNILPTAPSIRLSVCFAFAYIFLLS